MKRFASLTAAELAEIENARQSKQTKYNDVSVENMLKQYCNENQVELINDKENLDSVLSGFFASVRTKVGNYFTCGSLTNTYHSVARNILKKMDIDIRDETSFRKCHAMIKNMKAVAKKKGKGSVVHTDVIEDSDMKKLGDLAWGTPVLLQWKVWSLIQLHFAKRGNENVGEMKKADLLFKKMADGQELMEIQDNITKNHRAGDSSASYGGLIHSTGHENCPVKIVKFYLSKLHPNNDYLWQRPRDSYLESEVVWYCDAKVGVNKLRSFMPTISSFLRLSKRYTNHTLRATAITLLGEKFQDTDVRTVSGHKSVSSLAIYKRTSLEQRKNMSLHLHNALNSYSPNGVPIILSDDEATTPMVLPETSFAENVVGKDLSQTQVTRDTSCDPPLLSPMVLPETTIAENVVDEDLSQTQVTRDTSCDPPLLSPKIEGTKSARMDTCVRVDGNSFNFSGSNCTINITFQSAK
jgi:hypothetical protein